MVRTAARTLRGINAALFADTAETKETANMSTIHLLDPAVRAIVASLKVFDPEHDSLDAFRAQSRAMYAQMSPPIPDARDEHRIPGTPCGPGAGVPTT